MYYVTVNQKCPMNIPMNHISWYHLLFVRKCWDVNAESLTSRDRLCVCGLLLECPSQVAMMIFETWLLSITLLIVGGDGGSLPTGPLRLLRLLRRLEPVNQWTARTALKSRHYMLNAIGITVTGPSKFAKQLFQALAFGTDLAFAAGRGPGRAGWCANDLILLRNMSHKHEQHGRCCIVCDVYAFIHASSLCMIVEQIAMYAVWCHGNIIAQNPSATG